MTIVTIDGTRTEPTTASAITVAAGQRYEVIITGKSNPQRNYAITSVMPDVGLQTDSILSYGSSLADPAQIDGGSLNPIDDFTIKPASGMQLLTGVDNDIELPVSYTGNSGRR
jgi:FtsP/CotA-like multicopper oxidase with cupredoxin domain